MVKLEDVIVHSNAVHGVRKRMLLDARQGRRKVRLVRTANGYRIGVHRGEMSVVTCSREMSKKDAVRFCEKRCNQIPPTRAVKV